MSTLATFSTVFSTNCMFYYHVYAVNQSVALGLNTAIKVMNAFIFCIFIYLNLYRWSRLCAINQNSCVISFNRLTIGQKRYAITILPVVGYTIFRMVWFFVTTGYGPSPMFWQYQSESTIIADVCASYLCLASIASKLLYYYLLLFHIQFNCTIITLTHVCYCSYHGASHQRLGSGQSQFFETEAELCPPCLT